MDTNDPTKQEQALEGLNPRDEDRAHSMADEGGAAGAVVEAQRAVPAATPRPARPGLAVALGMTSAAVCGGLAALWLRRR